MRDPDHAGSLGRSRLPRDLFGVARTSASAVSSRSESSLGGPKLRSANHAASTLLFANAAFAQDATEVVDEHAIHEEGHADHPSRRRWSITTITTMSNTRRMCSR